MYQLSNLGITLTAVSRTKIFFNKYSIKSATVLYFSVSNAKSKRNGLVSNPAMRLVVGVKNGIENAANRNKPITTRVNGFQWKAETRKETPL